MVLRLPDVFHMCGFLNSDYARKLFFITYHCRCWRCWSWRFWRSLQYTKIKHTENCTQTVFNDTKNKMHLFHYKIIQFCNGEFAFEKDMQISLLRLSSLPTWDSSLEAWTGGVQVVEGLPSCDPGWGGGQSLVVGVLTVEVELVVTVLLLVVELGVVVGDWN